VAFDPSGPHAGAGGARKPGDERQNFLEHLPRHRDFMRRSTDRALECPIFSCNTRLAGNRIA
jgi:hypothetical protein